MRQKLERHRSGEGFRAEIETVAGEECIDLTRFASDVVFGSYALKKRVMTGATRSVSESDLQRSMARNWVEQVWPKHVEAAVGDGRLPRKNYLEKLKVRKGNGAQSKGVAVGNSIMLKPYA